MNPSYSFFPTILDYPSAIDWYLFTSVGTFLGLNCASLTERTCHLAGDTLLTLVFLHYLKLFLGFVFVK